MLILSGLPGGRELVDLANGGTFTRATEGSLMTGAPNEDGGFFRFAAINERRFENRGDGAGALFLSETSHSNGFIYSRDFGNAAWLNDAAVPADITVTPDYAPGLDGTMKAGRVQFQNATSAFYQVFISLTTATMFAWLRARSGTALINTSFSSGSGSRASAGHSLTETWQFCQLFNNTGPAWQSFGPLDSKDRSTVGGILVPLPQDILVDGVQFDSVAYPRSWIRSTGGTPGTMAADVLTFAVGQYPTRLLNARAEFAQVSPMFASFGADLPVNNPRWLLSFGGGSNGIRLIQSTSTTLTAQALSGGAVVASSQPISGVSRHGLLGAVSWDPAAGRVYVNGVPGHAGTPWSWAAATMRVGGIQGGTSEANCRLGALRSW